MDIPGYTLKHRIAQGRYAALYLAEDAQGVTRAIKIIHSSLANQFQFRQAFKKHIKILSAIKHANCMRVHDAGITGRTCYIVMDYYPNGSIAPRLIFGFQVKQITQIIMQIIDVLEYFKKINIQHGNIQPRNIFLTKDNRTILSEYEIVPQILKSCPDIYFNEDEQVLNQLVDTQSDLSCLGLVFFKLLNRETTPYLEIPVHSLSGKRAECWQATINKLFSNRMEQSISSIDQFRQEIIQVQNAFKNKKLQANKQNSNAKHHHTDKINSKDIDKAFEKIAVTRSDTLRHNLPVIVKPLIHSSEKSVSRVVNQFLLKNKMPIMTSIAASTAFFLILSGISFFNMKNTNFSAFTDINMTWVDDNVKESIAVQVTKIVFPGEPISNKNSIYTKPEKYPDLVTSIEELQQLTQADIKQKNRLEAIHR